MNHYHHLSIEERESILFMRGEGKGIRAIATALGRSASTISRELKRNQTKKEYSPSQAEKKYRRRRKRCCRKKILADPNAKAVVRETNDRRKTYHKYYTGQDWGHADNYDLCLNVSRLGVDGVLEMIASFIQNKK